MVKIRMRRTGCKNHATYRIVAADERSPRDGKFLEILGWYDTANGYPYEVMAMNWVGLILVCFVLPAVLSLVFDFILRKIGLVKEGDMKLEL